MRILYVFFGGVAVYACIVVGMQNLKSFNTVVLSPAIPTEAQELPIQPTKVISEAPSSETTESIAAEPSPELMALSIELASQYAAAGRSVNKKNSRPTTTTPVVVPKATTTPAVSATTTPLISLATTTKPVMVLAACIQTGITLQSGQSSVFYSAQSVIAPAQCAAVSQTRLCTNGALSGTSTYQYASCLVTQPPLLLPPAPTSTMTTLSMPVPMTKKLWGAFVGGSYAASALSAFEAQIGSAVNLQAVFIGWGSGSGDFPIELATPLKSSGKTLIIFWEPSVDLDAIASGSWDAYMRAFAASVKSYEGPVILAPFHEMNGNWDVWDGPVGTNSPAKFILAWKHMHEIFDAIGVPNVKWGWAVNNESVPNTAANKIENYYPGNTYVDIVGVDGFNFSAPWMTFDQVFGSALNRISVYGKPIYIFSFASAAGTQKAAWITDALAVQMYKYPLLAGWIWFNENKEQNWLINSDAAALAAFKAALP